MIPLPGFGIFFSIQPNWRLDRSGWNLLGLNQTVGGWIRSKFGPGRWISLGWASKLGVVIRLIPEARLEYGLVPAAAYDFLWKIKLTHTRHWTRARRPDWKWFRGL